MDDLALCKRIKITNAPRDHGEQGIREAFQAETGKAVTCWVDDDTCYITFLRAADARKAVETFDRGSLGGRTVGVALDP